MDKAGRKEKVIKNVSSQIVASLIQSILGFVLRKIFLDCLGQSLLGLNGLMTSIIGMLSLAELGVGEAINFSLYEPLAKNDKDKIISIMNLYKKLYISIGIIITLIGILLFPFLQFFIKTNISSKTVNIAYILFIIDTFLSYCLAYNRNIVSADQKDYIIINIDTGAQIILNISQIIFLLATRNYYIYLSLQVIITFIRNFYIYTRTKKMYPYLKSNKIQPLSKEYINKLISNIKALFATKIAYFCVSGTDNLLLSSFVSLTSVAIYNNYLTIINLLNRTFNMIITKASSVIANFIVLNSKEESYLLFKRIFFVNYIITSYVTIGIMLFCNKVITLWLGPHNTWSLLLVYLLSYNNYSRYILQTCEAFRAAAGLYSPKPFVKYISLFEGIINLIFSLFFIYIMNNPILGIFCGTAVSTLVSTFGVPWIVYRFLFDKSLKDFFIIYIKYFSVAIITFLLSKNILDVVFSKINIFNLILEMIIYSLIIFFIYYITFRYTDEFKYNINILKNLLNKK